MRILMEHQRAVAFLSDNSAHAGSPDRVFLLPFTIERMRSIELRFVALDIPSRDTITRDNANPQVHPRGLGD